MVSSAFTTLLRRIGVWPETGLRDVGKLLALAALVGVVAGLGAIAFHAMCLGIEWVGLDHFGGYRAEGPAGEVRWLAETTSPFRWWMLLIIPTVGGLISGLLVFLIAPEAKGHGTDAAIEAFHRARGVIRARVPIVKMIASAITIATGGSGGREGPIAQIGAGFGSYLATRLRLTDQERRTLLAAGLGAGIGAIFHAPLAGAIFSAEVLYRDPDFEAENLIPAFIATTIAYCVFALATNFGTLFDIPAVAFDNPLLLLPLAALAVTMVVSSYFYTKTFYGVEALFDRIPIKACFKPMIGALLTGATAVALYFLFAPSGHEAQHDVLGVLSSGYGYLQKILRFEGGVDLLIPVLLAVGIGKILTTSLTIGSGGSGGVFGPSMVIGGALGAVVGLLFHGAVPGLVGEKHVVIFAILGMAGFFAAAANTPLSTLLIVSELTAGYALLLPSMWVCALSYTLARGWTLYDKQVQGRRDSPAHRGDFIIDVLQGLTVDEAIRPHHRQFVTVSLDLPLGEMDRLITDTTQTSFPVVDGEDRYYGLYGINDIRQFLYDQSDLAALAVAQDLARTNVEPLTLTMDLSTAMGMFGESAYDELPVVDPEEPGKIVALLQRQDLIATYSARLLAMRQTDA